MKYLVVVIIHFVLGVSICPIFAVSDLPRKYADLKSTQIVQKAERGDSDAQYELGYRYARGYKSEIKQDKTEAAKWYRVAAEKGHVLAMHDMAYVLSTSGEGVEIDLEEAFKFYFKAAEAGDSDSMCRLGNAYQGGRGTPLEKEQAVRWYGEAAKCGHQLAPLYILAMYLQKQYDFPPEDIFKYASAAAAEKPPVREQFGTRSQEPGDRVARRILGDLYLSGNGTPRNLSAAVKWYKKAAEQGDIPAQVSLASMYEAGQGISKSPQQAFKWYYEAATFDSSKATMSNGGFLDHGLYQQSFNNDSSVIASSKAGEMLVKGVGTAKDIEKGVDFLTRASDKGNLESVYLLGLMYWNGEGIAKNPELAVKWLRKAAAEGEPKSIKALSEFGIDN